MKKISVLILSIMMVLMSIIMLNANYVVNAADDLLGCDTTKLTTEDFTITADKNEDTTTFTVESSAAGVSLEVTAPSTDTCGNAYYVLNDSFTPDYNSTTVIRFNAVETNKYVQYKPFIEDSNGGKYHVSAFVTDGQTISDDGGDEVVLKINWSGETSKLYRNGVEIGYLKTFPTQEVLSKGIQLGFVLSSKQAASRSFTVSNLEVWKESGEPYLTLKGEPTEKFFAGEYQIHVPAPQRAGTVSFTVLGVQYQDGHLVSITPKTFDFEKIDVDTEMVLDVTVADETDQLTCMVWESLRTMKPIIMKKNFEKILPDEDAPYAILKFDDLGPGTVEAFQKAIDVCEEEGVVASLGLIGKRFNDETDPSVYTTIQNWHDNGFEIWHHGFEHSPEEYSTYTYEQQKESFGKVLDLIQEKCGITITAFGSPHNNSTELTRDMIEENFPQIKAIMLASYEGTNNITVLNKQVRLEAATAGVMADYQTVQNRYANRRSGDVIVMQGHPSGWDEEELLKLKLIIQFLKQKGCIFITPTEYVNMCVNK
ncbi:MAG: DUF2334 domain-containing protein [Clostridia bacterium]|nr:DUF2334 domain-containing protein [Clostridia bacterium]